MLLFLAHMVLYLVSMFKLLNLLFILLSLVGYTFSSASCTNSTFCKEVFGNESYCNHHTTNSTSVCGCKNYYYLTNTNSCEGCPGYGESCEVSGCCNNANLFCMDKVCTCFWAEYCWIVDDDERDRLQIAAQIILAISLFLTATILFILFWKSCARHTSFMGQNRRLSQRNRLSLNSIQRMVLMQLQDRPPPYDSDLMSPCKHLDEGVDAPPSYSDAVQLPPLGEANLAFFIGGISQSTHDSLETPPETSRNNHTLPMSSQSNTENQNELNVSEANSHIVESGSDPLIWVMGSAVNNNALQSTEGTNNISSTTHHELHI